MALETIIKQQQQEIGVLKKKNNMLENQIKRINSRHSTTEEINVLKTKTEEDFYKEVIEAKHNNVMLAEYIESVEEENKILKEKVQMLTTTSRNYVVNIEGNQNEEISKEKDEQEIEQEIMHEKTIGIMERLLGKSTEMNFELAEILEETDETVEEYKKNNNDAKKNCEKH